MRMTKWIIAVLIVISPLVVDAQCSMCKAVAESSQDGGSSIADGLNHGIVYLMTIPYILMGAVGFALYRHKKTASKA